MISNPRRQKKSVLSERLPSFYLLKSGFPALFPVAASIAAHELLELNAGCKN
jgi:hypothetical protein